VILLYYSFTATTILSLTYGHDIKSQDHPVVELVKKLTDIIVKEATPEKAAILETFPFGKLHPPLCPPRNALNIRSVKFLPSWLPGLGFIDRAAIGKQISKDVLEQPFEYTKSEVVSS
jgi:hypothetical protein